MLKTTILLIYVALSLSMSNSVIQIKYSEKYLSYGEVLEYSGSAPRFFFIGSDLGRIELKTIATPGKIKEKNNYKLGLQLTLSKKLQTFYSYSSNMSSLVDYNMFRCLDYKKHDIKGKNAEHRFEEFQIDYEKGLVSYSKYRSGEKNKFKTKIKFDSRPLLDPISLIYYLRSLNYSQKEGRSPEFYIFNRGKILQVSIDYSITTIKFNDKNREVIHIKPSEATRGSIIKDKDIEIFLDPVTKIPLLIRIIGFPVIGELEMKLIRLIHPKFGF